MEVFCSPTFAVPPTRGKRGASNPEGMLLEISWLFCVCLWKKNHASCLWEFCTCFDVLLGNERRQLVVLESGVRNEWMCWANTGGLVLAWKDPWGLPGWEDVKGSVEERLTFFFPKRSSCHRRRGERWGKNHWHCCLFFPGYSEIRWRWKRNTA